MKAPFILFNEITVMQNRFTHFSLRLQIKWAILELQIKSRFVATRQRRLGVLQVVQLHKIVPERAVSVLLYDCTKRSRH